ncbi:longitudinals lacking protein, isoforms A/B/D/L-like isoform X3 [Cimex lectularius]|uniref:BTB domain-containing protein n=1 Tax=Cimex lectularius TaxID=79782 RepID=A0A8I6THY4_CIMLE|nr:longitudinals lacking protein, isoforms A/B/D/L-like isoform X3 [Cimex lectularius]
MDEDDYHLKWAKHHDAFVSLFDQYFDKEILVDCTLAAEDKFVKVHRIVVMACSPYLQDVLSQYSLDFHPVVYTDLKFSVLQSIVRFCYQGEVTIAHNELEDFIHGANLLQIKGIVAKKDSCSQGKDSYGSAGEDHSAEMADSDFEKTESNHHTDLLRDDGDGQDEWKKLERFSKSVFDGRTLTKSVVERKSSIAACCKRISDEAEFRTARERARSLAGNVQESVELQTFAKHSYTRTTIPIRPVERKSSFAVFKRAEDETKFQKPAERVLSRVGKTSSTKEHRCDCGKSYRLKETLESHKKHECGRGPAILCPYCEYTAKKMVRVKSHIYYEHGVFFVSET